MKTRTVVEVVFDNLSDYVGVDVLDWHIDDFALYFREATSPNRTTYFPICAIKWYSVENVPVLSTEDVPVPSSEERTRFRSQVKS